MITFTCNIKPHPQQRARRSKNGGMFDPKSNKIYAAAIRQAFRLANPNHVPFRGAVGMSIEFRFAIPKSKAKERNVNDWHIQKPDKSNLVKAIEDALKGLAWVDDCQICDDWSVKVWDEESSVSVNIWEIEKCNNESHRSR